MLHQSNVFSNHDELGQSTRCTLNIEQYRAQYAQDGDMASGNHPSTLSTADECNSRAKLHSLPGEPPPADVPKKQAKAARRRERRELEADIQIDTLLIKRLDVHRSAKMRRLNELRAEGRDGVGNRALGAVATHSPMPSAPATIASHGTAVAAPCFASVRLDGAAGASPPPLVCDAHGKPASRDAEQQTAMDEYWDAMPFSLSEPSAPAREHTLNADEFARMAEEYGLIKR